MAVGLRVSKFDDKNQPTRVFSDNQEKQVAKAVGGKQTANSGATDFSGKSDVNISNIISLECKTKTTSSKSITIKKEWFQKMKEDCVFDGHYHTALVFNFGPNEENHYIIDEYLFNELVEVLKQQHNIK